MPPNQDKNSNGKRIDMIYAHNYFVFYSCKKLRIDLAHDATVGDRSRKSKFFLRITKIYLWSNLATRGRGVHLHTLVDSDAEALQERE